MKCDHLGRSLGSLLALSAAVSAQISFPTNPAKPAPRIPDAFVVPIHSAEADDGVPYGIWASGHDYKVSFHDGMSFVPVLGADAPENLPFRWKSTQVLVGGLPLDEGHATGTHYTDWRFERTLANGVVEAYDVRPDGVEQTFVLASPPQGLGGLVIRGSVETALRAEPAFGQHRALTFRDAEGNAVIEYGAATAIDANGQTLPMRTFHEDGLIELHVPGHWLANAAYPVVVDPLLSSVKVARHLGSSREIADTDVAYDSHEDAVLVAYTRAVSASDHDSYARVTDEDYSNSAVIYSDVTDTWSTPRTSCALVGGEGKWIVVFERDFPISGYSGIRWHLHDVTDRNSSTNYSAIPVPNSETHRFPDVGGSQRGRFSIDEALVVFQVDITTQQANTATTEVYGVIIDGSDGANGSDGPKFVVSANPVGANRDREHASVNKSIGGASGEDWVVCFQEYDAGIPNDDWDIRVLRVATDGSVQQGLSSSLGNWDASVHSERPQVDGQAGRYMVSFVERTNIWKIGNGSGLRLRVHRFDWPAEDNSRTPRELNTIAENPGTAYWNGGIAYDSFGDTHWGVVYTDTNDDIYAARLGFAAGVAETINVHRGLSEGLAPSITFQWPEPQFTIAYGTGAIDSPLYLRGMTRFDAQNVLYGTRCGTGQIESFTAPHAGNEFYQVRLVDATPNAAAVLLLSFSDATLPLTGVGMPGCVLNVEPGRLLGTLSTTTSPGGNVHMSIPLPAPLDLDLFAQWAYMAPGMNPLGLAATSGMRIEIR